MSTPSPTPLAQPLRESGVACVDPNLAFTKCKAENADPEACLKLGSAVLACNNDV